MVEYVILVDKNDNKIGLEEKVKCHLPNGKLHRAFTALLFDKEGRLILTRRSLSKMLWPGDWDGTFASHPRENETFVTSAKRRMPEELGFQCEMDYLMKFEYHVLYKDIGSENEICGTLIGIIDDLTSFKVADEEISEVKAISARELKHDLEKNSQIYCPWMLIALFLLPSSKKSMLEKYKTTLDSWIEFDIRKSLEKSIKYYFPDKNWRLVN
ncbi:MAG TPA: isopentenyl-diphosphate Delta-isomerase [Nitrosopumilaceae archaeon]|nr:isopentenyl-diphosphate Delta-isomerase [Nitrosopumilaceae archaeon]